MTKKEKCLRKSWIDTFGDDTPKLNKQLDILVTHDYILDAMEEYGKYCAERSLIAFGELPDVEVFEDWWNEFKAKENEKTT